MSRRMKAAGKRSGQVIRYSAYFPQKGTERWKATSGFQEREGEKPLNAVPIRGSIGFKKKRKPFLAKTYKNCTRKDIATQGVSF